MSKAPDPSSQPRNLPGGGILDWLERLGNKLPEPAIIFVILAAVVIVAASIGSAAGWKVQPVQPRPVMIEKLDASGAKVLDSAGKPVMTPKLDASGKAEVTLVNNGEPISPRSLLNADGLYWMFSSMLRNFTTLPALGLISSRCSGSGLRRSSDSSAR
jgi:aminobenzoyl-glutamate transport protein